MTPRLNIMTAAPTLMKDYQTAMTNVAAAITFDPNLLELVKLRASQINGCANCINLHMTMARENGETEQRICLLPAWREAPCYSERERAALAWTDALTRLCEGDTHTAAYDSLKAHFTDEEQVKLTIAINVINGWNRMAVGFGLFMDPAAIRASAKDRAA